MKIKSALFFLLLVVIAPTASVLAQDTCPALVQNALEVTGNACEGIGRNQICYGHTAVELEAHDSNVSLPFNAPGDLASIADVQTIRLVSMDDLFSEWGVALMKLQANIPDTLPGENVTFVLFGDVEIKDAAQTNVEPLTLNLTANNTVNVRGGPSTSDPVVASLPSGQQVVADGRNEAGDWLHIQLEDEQTGWVFASLVTVDGDAALLDVVTGDAAPSQPPLEAFYLRTGISDSLCGEAPGSGLLIQTPRGVGTVNFTVNNVNIQLGSTVYLQAQPGGQMTVTVLEGNVRVTANGTTVPIPGGAQVNIPLNGEGVADGPPGDVVPYGDQSALGGVVGLLPISFNVPAEMSEADLDAFLHSPLYSRQYGDACVPGGVTYVVEIYNKPDDQPEVNRIVRAPVGRWQAQAGTTAIISVSGDLSLKKVSDPNAYISLILAGKAVISAFAYSSGDATTLSYTFEESREFIIVVAVYVPEGETHHVTVTVECGEAQDA